MARAKLTDDEVRDGLTRLPGWSREGDEIVKVYELPTFMEAIDLVGRIAALAEAADHHPDLDIRYRKVRVALSTHDSGGLTAADLELAGGIEGASGNAGERRVILAVVGGIILLLCVALVIAVTRDPGPRPDEVAFAYELAWDRLDFDSLWTLSGTELHDGLDRKSFISAKHAAYASRPELGRLARDVTIDDAVSGADHAVVRTNVVLRDGEVVHNQIHLAKRSGKWLVVGYQLEPDIPRPV